MATWLSNGGAFLFLFPICLLPISRGICSKQEQLVLTVFAMTFFVAFIAKGFVTSYLQVFYILALIISVVTTFVVMLLAVLKRLEDRSIFFATLMLFVALRVLEAPSALYFFGIALSIMMIFILQKGNRNQAEPGRVN